MKKYVKAIEYIGTILLWFPIALTIIMAIVGSIAEKRLLVDYLLPAELFLLTLIGGAFLVLAAWLSKRYKKTLSISFLIMIAALAGTRGAAGWTGVASGDTEAAGVPWILGLSLLGLYIAMVILQGILGTTLLRSDKERT